MENELLEHSDNTNNRPSFKPNREKLKALAAKIRQDDGNIVISILLRRVGSRIWECKTTCEIHGCSATAADIDNGSEVLEEALYNLGCGCYRGLE